MTCGHCREYRTARVRTMYAHWRDKCPVRQDWARVVRLRAEGRFDAADRLAARLKGIEPEPMPEETKAALRKYNEDHKEERKLHDKVKRAAARRTKELVRARRKR